VISRSSISDAYPTKRLGEVVEFLDSMRRPVTESDRCAGPFPYYGANGLQGTIDDFIFDEPLVLLAEDGGHFGAPDRGIAYRVSGKTWVNNHAHVLRPKSSIDLGFLCRVLENYDVTPWVTGTTRGKLTQAGASQIVVPVPPLPEQRRIAEVLDRADALRAMRRAALAQLDTLTQSIFLDMFGDPIENPRKLPVRRMIDLVDPARPISYGILMPGPDQSEGIPYVRVVDMQSGGIELSRIRKTTEAISHSYRRSLLNPGDLLMSIRGHVGRFGVVPPELDGANITQDSARLAIVGADSVFVRECLRTEGFQRWMAKHTKGVAVRGINLGDVKLMPIILPRQDDQQNFATLAASIDKLAVAARASLVALDRLFSSLQHCAFRGEL